MSDIHYYEVEMRHSDKAIAKADYPFDTYTMCILGKFKPTLGQAKEFLAQDMEEMGYDMVSNVREISQEATYGDYDIGNEESHLPILGSKGEGSIKVICNRCDYKNKCEYYNRVIAPIVDSAKLMVGLFNEEGMFKENILNALSTFWCKDFE